MGPRPAWSASLPLMVLVYPLQTPKRPKPPTDFRELVAAPLGAFQSDPNGRQKRPLGTLRAPGDPGRFDLASYGGRLCASAAAEGRQGHDNSLTGPAS